MALLIPQATAAAESQPDTVTLLGTATTSPATVTGKIIDYTGKQLELEVGSGAKRKIPAEQVSGVTTTLVADHLAADGLYARQDYVAALNKYQAAYEQETRRWVRRQIIAQMVRTARGQLAFSQAGEYFLSLVKDDPDALEFAAIPLAWLATDSGGSIETKAQAWLQRDDPVAQLLGASHLLLGTQRAAAEAQLQQLSKHRDLRIASLAEIQQLRITSGLNDAPAWNQAWAKVTACPEKLRAGPYYTLGRIAFQGERFDDAELTLLRVPILYAQEHALASESLLLTAAALMKQSRTDEAQRIMQELVDRFPQSRASREARQRAGDWGVTLNP